MNRLLIGTLDALNKLIAIALVATSTVSGYWGEFGAYAVSLASPLERALSTAIGFIAGIVVAALVSGFLATVINISREMTAIRHLLGERPVATTR